MMTRIRIGLTAAILFLSITLCAPLGQAGETKIRFGTLPVLQALPLYVAEEKGVFTKHGVAVELVPFNTATEKDMALRAGAIDGYFGDLFTPVVIRSNGVNVKIVAVNYDTLEDRRMFAVLAAEKSDIRSTEDLAGVPVAVSSNSVIDYVTEKLLEKAGVPQDRIERLESKNIGLRMQMLMSGQVKAATLPEPLVTAAAKKGARILADDSGLKGSQTVLVFLDDFIDKHPDAVKAFLAAVGEAHQAIERQPDSVRSVMTAKVRLPRFLQQTYPVPTFPELHPPRREIVESVIQWLNERGVLRNPPTYDELVEDRFVP